VAQNSPVETSMQAAPPAHDVGLDRHEEVGGRGLEELVLDDRARGDEPDDAALDQLLGLGGVLQLLGDGDLVPRAQELGQVALGAVEGHAAHGEALARGQDQAADGGRGLGVGPEELVEVSQAEEEQGFGMLGLELLVLPHHGGVGEGLRRGHGAILAEWRAL